MAVTVGDAVVYYRGDNKDALRSMDDTERKSRSWASRLGGIVKTGLIGGTLAVVGLGAAMGKLAFDAMPLEGISKAFQGITGDAETALAALRKGSLGMVRDGDLMRSYNDAAQLVSKSFADDLPEAMQYLSKVSAATGTDMGYLMDSLTKGIGRLSAPILDNLSIQVDATAANEVYAVSVGKSTDELTKQEQQTALMNQVMEKLAENTKDMPDITENASTKWAQLTTVFANLKDGIGLALLPALTSVLGTLAEQAPIAIEKAKAAFGELKDIFTEKGFLGGLQELGGRFWDWLTGEYGVINAGVFLIQHRFIPQITYEFNKTWPAIRDMTMQWATDFWDWLTGEGGVIDQLSAKSIEISKAFAEWVNGPEAQDSLKHVGTEIGKALGNGIKWLFSQSGGDEGNVLMLGVSRDMLDAARRNIDSFAEIGASIEAYMITGFWEALTGKKVADETAQKIKDVLKLIVKMTNPASIGLELFYGIWEPFQNAWNNAIAFLKGEQLSYNMSDITPWNWLPSMASGGTVPGPIGAPMPIIAHGGERVVPQGGSDDRPNVAINFSFGGAYGREEAKAAAALTIDALRVQGVAI